MSPHSPTLCKRLAPLVAGLLVACATPLIGVENWLEVRTRHFEITSALDPDSTRQLATDLENFRAGIEFLLDGKLSPPPIRTRVYAFDGRTVVRPFDQRGASGYTLPSLDGALIVLRTGGGWRRDATDELRLAYTRFLLRNREGLDLPLWYDEGFGLFASTLKLGNGYFDVGLPRPDYVVLLRDRLHLSLERLIQLQDLTKLGARERQVFDAESWALVHYLTFETGHPNQARRRFARYFDLVERGMAYPRALKQAFGEGPGALERGLAHYVRERSFNAMEIKIHGEPDARPPTARRLRPTRALSRFGWLAIQLDRPKRARPYFQRALELDARNASANSGLGAVDRIEKNWSGAEAHYARALELAPKDPLVQLEVGRYYAARAQQAAEPEARAENARRAREHFETSLSTLSTNPEAYALIGSTYLLPGQDAKRAGAPLESAQALLPSSLEIELLRARAEFALGKLTSARYLATAVASRTHSRPLSRQARRFLDEIGGSAAGDPAPLRQPRPRDRP